MAEAKVKRIASAILICILSVFFFGCEGITFEFLKTGFDGKVDLSIDMADATVIRPALTVSSYEIACSGPTSEDPVSTTATQTDIDLAPGTWTITVYGKDADGDTMAMGTQEDVEVKSANTTKVSVVLGPEPTGATGAVDVTLSWPGSVTPSIDGYAVTFDGTNVDASTITFTPTSVRYIEQKQTGVHALSILLMSGTMNRARVVRTVHVYAGLTSQGAVSLTGTDFSYPPEAPSGLAVNAGTNSLNLSWTDISAVETGYIVERSEGDNLHFSILRGDLPANRTSYSDASAAVGVTYWYRVAARNELGASGYSNQASGRHEAAATGAIIADHSIMNLVKDDRVPESAIQQAKDLLRVAYDHKSHGQQPLEGMTGLVPFKEALGGTPGLYAWNQVDSWATDVQTGKMNIDDFFSEVDDLGYYPDWLYATRKYLGWNCGSGNGSNLADYATGTPDYNSVANVVMWAWCAFAANKSNSDEYLAAMDSLIADYPEVTFVHMTAHANSTGYFKDAIPVWNAYITQHCIDNNHVLFDFYDIECYDLDGNYFGDKHVDASCAYDKTAPGAQDGNWGTEYQLSHPQNTDWYTCAAAHTQPVNANQKAYAMWWLLARIAGWDGTPLP
jgi:hypothetical protein